MAEQWERTVLSSNGWKLRANGAGLVFGKVREVRLLTSITDFMGTVAICRGISLIEETLEETTQQLAANWGGRSSRQKKRARESFPVWSSQAQGGLKLHYQSSIATFALALCSLPAWPQSGGVATISAGPGTVVRWRGAGTTRCGMKGRSRPCREPVASGSVPDRAVHVIGREHGEKKRR